MTESNTRKWWRARLEGFAMDTVARNNAGHVSGTEAWLDDLMQTPELSLAELAESRNNEAEFNGAPRDYKIAVIYDAPKPDFQGNDSMEIMWNAGYRRVVEDVK